MNRMIIVHNGVLFEAVLLGCADADSIARDNNHVYAEGFVDAHENGSLLTLNAGGKVKRINKLEKR